VPAYPGCPGKRGRLTGVYFFKQFTPFLNDKILNWQQHNEKAMQLFLHLCVNINVMASVVNCIQLMNKPPKTFTI